MTLWSFLHISKVTQNNSTQQTYNDQIGNFYSWDSTVANHARVKVLDKVLIVDERFILGSGIITKLSIETSSKVRSRCAKCASTKISARTEITPVYRCALCKFEFDIPAKENIEVLSYIAYYGDAWRPFNGLLKKILEPAYRSKAVQQSIRQLDKSFLPLEVSEWSQTT